MDMNFDGSDDGVGGWEGMCVYLYDCDGIVDSTLTNTNGDYFFDVSGDIADNEWRIEFRPKGALEFLSPSTTDEVQFTDSPSCSINIGFGDAAAFCQSADMVDLATTCYVQGDPNDGGDAVVTWSYDQTGETGSVAIVADVSSAGAVYGLTYRKTTEELFTLSVLKRHIADGVGGLDAIYVMDLSGCLLYTSPSPRDRTRYRMPSSA